MIIQKFNNNKLIIVVSERFVKQLGAYKHRTISNLGQVVRFYDRMS
jgi:hypothetical protein